MPNVFPRLSYKVSPTDNSVVNKVPNPATEIDDELVVIVPVKIIFSEVYLL
jgi:hypothetical protein